ncbi:MAG TPA: response regulator transcription factor [Candidatus Dormibacteraeota bacterium]
MILADDSVLLREGLASVLTGAGFTILAQVGDADALLRCARADPPDVAIVDIRMPPTHTTEGLQAALTLREELPAVGVLVLSQHVETQYAMKLVGDGSGGVGYLLKDRVAELDEFLDAVRRVGGGGSVIDPLVVSRLVGRGRERRALDELTTREREVLALMAEGRSNHAISERLFITPKTVEAHARNIFSKLGIEEAADDNRRVLSVLAYLRTATSLGHL